MGLTPEIGQIVDQPTGRGRGRGGRGGRRGMGGAATMPLALGDPQGPAAAAAPVETGWGGLNQQIPLEKPAFSVEEKVEYVSKPSFVVEERSERVIKPSFSVVERPEVVEKPVFVTKEIEIVNEKRQILEKVSLSIHNSDWVLRILLGVSAAVHLWSTFK